MSDALVVGIVRQAIEVARDGLAADARWPAWPSPAS